MAGENQKITRDLQFYKFCGYGFFKNLRLYEPFLLLFFLSQGLSFLQIGILYSVREITRNVLEIPAGILADALGRRRTMIFSFALYIISFLVFYGGSRYSLFIAAMVFYALGDAFRTGTHKAMIFDYLKIHGWSDQKALYYGHTRSCSQFGSAISALVGGFMVFFSGNFRDIFLYSSVPYILDLILIASYPRSLDGMRARIDQQRLKENIKTVVKDFVTAFRKIKMLKATVNLSIHTGYFRALKDFLQPVLQSLALSVPVLLFLENKQRTAVVVGMVYFVIYLLTSMASRSSGRFSARFSDLGTPLNITLIFGLASGLMSGIFFQADWLVLSVVFFVLIFLFENLRKPMGVSRIAEVAKEDSLASILSAESQLHALIAALLAPVLGFLADQTGLGISIMIVSGVLMLLSVFTFIRRERSNE